MSRSVDQSSHASGEMSVCSANTHTNRISPIELSYGEMSTDASGRVMTKAAKKSVRKQYGYCLNCPGIPVQLMDIRKSRMNPLWTTKKPRSVEGQSLDGKCLKCNPDLKPRRNTRQSLTASPPSFHSSESSRSCASSTSSCSALTMATNDFSFFGNEEISDDTDGRSARGTVSNSVSSASRSGSRGRALRRPKASRHGDLAHSRSGAGSVDGVRDRPTLPTPTSSDHGRLPTFVEHDSPRSSKSRLSRSYQEGDPSSISTVDDLSIVLNQVKATGCADILSESLVDRMLFFHSDRSAQLLCLKTICDFFDEDSIDSAEFIQAKGDLCVLEAMERFPSSLEIQERGCNAISLLAANERNRLCLIRNGACDSLMKSVSRYLGDASLVLHAFTAFRIFSTDPEACNILRCLSLQATAVEAMQSNMRSALSPSIQLDGCAILSNMAVDAASSTVSEVGQSVVDVVVEAMQRHKSDESVQASACFCLKNFTYNDKNLRIMSNTEDIMESLEIASEFSSIFSAEEIKEKVYFSMAMDASLEEEAHTTLKAKVAEQHDNPEIVIVVVDILKSFQWSKRMVGACFKILKSLTLTSEPHKREFLDRIDREQLRDFAKRFPCDVIVQEEAAVLACLFSKVGSLDLLSATCSAAV